MEGLSRLVLAFCLITSDAEPFSIVDYKDLQFELANVAVSLQIANNHETYTIFGHYEQDEYEDEEGSRYVSKYVYTNMTFVNGFREIRKRYAEFKNVPYAEDMLRFPDEYFLRKRQKFNNEYAQSLFNFIGYAGSHKHESYGAAILASENLNDIYENLCNAKSYSYSYPWNSRYFIKKYIEQVGEANYYAGILPPPAPTQFFTPLGK